MSINFLPWLRLYLNGKATIFFSVTFAAKESENMLWKTI